MAARQPELPARVGGETESGTQAGVWSTAWGQAALVDKSGTNEGRVNATVSPAIHPNMDFYRAHFIPFQNLTINFNLDWFIPGMEFTGREFNFILQRPISLR